MTLGFILTILNKPQHSIAFPLGSRLHIHDNFTASLEGAKCMEFLTFVLRGNLPSRTKLSTGVTYGANASDAG
jgi:hypothetical protein